MNLKLRHALALVLMHAAAQAGAQDATPADTGGLETITVTAQRRVEDVQSTALSINVLSTAALENGSVSRVSDLGAYVPALQVGEFGGGQQALFMRGVGIFVAQSYTDTAVSFNYDGIAFARSSSMTGVMYDLQRVEVLKGPQGTLYGRNATGGAINVIPNHPEIGDVSGSFSIGAGNYGQLDATAALNLPLGDTVAMRAAVNYLKRDGYQSDGTGDADDYAGRLQLLFQPSDDLSIRFGADYAHDGGKDSGGALIATQDPFTGAIIKSPLGRDIGFTDPKMGNLYGTIYSFISGRNIGPLDGKLFTDNTFWGTHAELNWTTDVGTLTILPAVRDAKIESLTAGLGFAEYAKEHDKQTSIEARFASPTDGAFSWLVGAYWFDEDIKATYQFNQQALAPIQNLDTGTTSTAGFARVTFAPMDALRLSLGARYTSDEKDFDGVSNILISACGVTDALFGCPNAPLIPYARSLDELSDKLALFPIFPGALYGSALPGAENSVFPLVSVPIDEKQSFSKWTFHGGIEYDVADDSLLYLTYDTGYHAGGFAFAEIKPTYDPETIDAWSLGSKNRFFDNRLQLNAEIFYWDYKDQQIPHGAIDVTGAYVFLTENAGASTRKGAELSIEFLATPATLLDLNVQYLKAEFDDFTYQTPAGGTNAPPMTGCPFSQTDATHYTVDCSGKTSFQSPEWTLNAGIKHTFPIGSYDLTGHLWTHYQSEVMTGFELVPVQEQDSYTQTSVSLDLAPQGGQWNVTVFANNLEDERPFKATYWNAIMSTFAASIGTPRTYGIRASFEF